MDAEHVQDTTNGITGHTSASLDTENSSTARSPKPSRRQLHLNASFIAILSHHLEAVFLPNIVPSQLEISVKEHAITWLQQQCHKVVKGATIATFGSMMSCLALKNADVDVCFILPEAFKDKPAVSLVNPVANALRRTVPPGSRITTKPRARVPIVNLWIPLNGLPAGGEFDISFNNPGAIDNTRLFWTYNRIDNRVKPLVLFVKLWAKQRRMCAAYDGFISSYSWTILVLHYLMNVAQPAVIPDLQHIARRISIETRCAPTLFLEDLSVLPQYWRGLNTQSTGELLIDFFAYYTNDYRFKNDAISLFEYGGLRLQEDSENEQSDRYDRIIIDDPLDPSIFVTKSCSEGGLQLIRAEFSRAYQLLTAFNASNAHDIQDCIMSIMTERSTWVVPPRTTR